MKKYSFCFLFFILSLFSYAQEEKEKVSLLPLPAFVVDPAIGVGFGGTLSAYHRFGSPENTRKSLAISFGQYTTKQQVVLSLEQTIFTNEDKYIIEGITAYRLFPQPIYGWGGRSPEENEELTDSKILMFRNRVLRKILPNWFMGLEYRYVRIWDISSEKETSESILPSLNGGYGVTSSGLGIHTFYDTRDVVWNATKGLFAEFAWNSYSPAFGSSFEFQYLRLDVRNYHRIFKNMRFPQVIAGRVFSEFTFGNVPYWDAPQTGISRSSRGYVLARYRGERYVTTELEYRSQLTNRIGYTVFANVHSISEENGNFAHWNPAAGFGLRLMFNRKERVNVRIDYAVGIEGNRGLYLVITEAF